MLMFYEQTQPLCCKKTVELREVAKERKNGLYKKNSVLSLLLKSLSRGSPIYFNKGLVPRLSL